jgi:hypothetical protein
MPEEYFHRLPPAVKHDQTMPNSVYSHRFIRQSHPVEQAEHTDLASQRSMSVQSSEHPFPERRRSSVRFEDELPNAKAPPEVPVVTQNDTITSLKEQKESLSSSIDTELERHVSFRNNEDDLWTTITIKSEHPTLVQASHFNRLTLENLSCVDTSIPNNHNGVTAIQITSASTPLGSDDVFESSVSSADIYSSSRLPPVSKSTCTSEQQRRSTSNTRKMTHASHSHTLSGQGVSHPNHIKSVKELQTVVIDKYNYSDLSEALKSNVQRLRKTFIQDSSSTIHNDRQRKLRIHSVVTTDMNSHSSNC